jgi:CRISPR-associated Csx2 family protein
MAKVLISFLGTGGYSDKNKSRGEYRTATYSIDGKEYECEFVAEALYKHYKIDRVIYIGTLKSMWEVVYDNEVFIQEPEEKQWEELSKVVENASYKSSINEYGHLIHKAFKDSIIHPVVLKYGLNEGENEFNIKQLFSIDNILKQNDKILIDISHGFRSLPIVLINVLNYIAEHSSKNIEIENISYGMFEVSNEMNNVSPIVNLNIIKELYKTTKAAHEFSEYGNAYVFAELLKNTEKSISSILKDFSDSKSLNHIYDLKSKIQQLKGLKFENLTEIQKTTIPKTINDFISRFNKAKTDSHYQYEIAKWMFDKKQYGFAAISLSESILTKGCELKGFDPGSERYRNEIKKLLRKIDPEANRIQKKIKNIRNLSAHSLASTTNVSKMISELEDHIKRTKEFIYK